MQAKSIQEEEVMSPAQDAEQNIRDQIKDYRKLQEVANSEVFETFFDMQIKTAAEKMMWAFLSTTTKSKLGIVRTKDNVSNWNEFLKVRAEIFAMLQPIQEVYGAEPMIKYLTQTLEQYKQQG